MTQKEEYADKWRKEYDGLTCSEQVKKLSVMQEDYVPHPMTTYNWREDVILDFFNYVFTKKEKVRVLEFGGGLGHLADYILGKYDDKIELWHNYDMQTFALTDCACKHPKYTGYVSTKFFWEQDFEKPYDVFVSTHSIEHIKGHEVKKLLDKMRSLVDFMYLESPICDDSHGLMPENNVNLFFVRCSALHILEIGWEQIYDMLLPNFVLLRDLSFPYIIGAHPPYPSKTDQSIPIPNVDVSIKSIFYEGQIIHIQMQKKTGVKIPGRGEIYYNSPRSTSGVRCFEKRDQAFAKEAYDKLMDDIIDFKKHIHDPVSPYVFEVKN